jgi:hypothetical protein
MGHSNADVAFNAFIDFLKKYHVESKRAVIDVNTVLRSV